MLNRMPPLEHMPDAPAANEGRTLYARIGDFLRAQRLEPSPANYAFGYTVIAQPDSTVAVEVARRIDGGVRLSRQDIDELGAETADAVDGPGGGHDLAERAKVQMDGFTDVVVAMHTHTREFGRELIASADAIERSREVRTGSNFLVDDVARITGLMIDRVREAERRLEEARREAEDLRQALEEARGHASSDPLTGLPNRRAFEDAYAQRIASGASPCIAVCDVDHFKEVNDRFGHAVGDRVLRAIGTSLSSACDGHFVARFGGEEFAIMFEGSLASATHTIDLARRNISRKRFRVKESDVLVGTVTFSAGISIAARGEPLQPVFERADRLLYAAKAAGRDCVFSDGDISN